MKKLLIFVVTLAVVVIFSLPHLVGLIRYGKYYSPLGIENYDAVNIEETYTYAPRVVEISQKKQLFVTDPYVFENRNKPSPFLGETFPSYIMLFLSKIFGSVPNAFIAADFLFPGFIFLMIFAFIYKTTNKFLMAVAGGCVTIFLRDLPLLIPYPKATVEYFLNKGVTEFLPYSRAFHPEISFPIFFLFIISLFLCIKINQKKYIFSSGLILGALFYTYLFYWTTSLLAMIILLIFFVRSNRKNAKKLFYILLIAVFIGAPYFINMLIFRNSPAAISFVEMSSYPRETVLFLPVLRFLILILLIFLFKKKKNSLDYIFLSFMFSAVLLPNITNIVFGRNLEGIHYVRRTLLPLTTIYLFILFSKYHKKLIQIFITLLILVSFVFGLNVQLRSINKFGKSYVISKENRSLLNYLNKKTPRMSVIGSIDQEINLLIPEGTSHYVFFPRSNMTISSSEEILVRYFILSKILGYSKEEIMNRLKQKLGFYIFYFPWIEEKGIREKQIFDESWKKLMSFQMEKEKNKYKLDYILVQKQKGKKEKIFSVKSPVFQNDKYALFKL